MQTTEQMVWIATSNVLRPLPRHAQLWIPRNQYLQLGVNISSKSSNFQIETEQFRGGPCHQPERPTPDIPKPYHIFTQTYPTPTQAIKKGRHGPCLKKHQGCGTRHLPRLHHLWLQNLHHWGSGHLCCVLLWLSPHLRGQVWECQHDATRPHSHQQRELCSHNWWMNLPTIRL